MTTIISPSLLSCDFLNIEPELNKFNGQNDLWFHLDIMDGHFVPNLTFGFPIIKLIAAKTSIPLDVHLMVSNPEFHIDSYKDLGIHNITFHYETLGNQSVELIRKAKKYYKSVGISIKPHTPFSSLPKDILDEIDLLLVMSVEPGFGGQSFIESTYDKLIEISKSNPHFVIQVDGGVDDTNAKKLIDHGVNNLVAGSYIFKNKPYEQAISRLRG